MNKNEADINEAINEEIEKVEVALFYFGSENIGSLLECGLTFKSGKTFVLYCCGNGKVGVAKGVLKNANPTKDESIIVKKIQLIVGRLKMVELMETSFCLKFDSGSLTATNYDDELDIQIDRCSLDPLIYSR